MNQDIVPVQIDQWKVKEGIFIPCYLDKEHQETMEKLVQHENFSQAFPPDSSLRSMLLPFSALYQNKGYYGLDEEGYQQFEKIFGSDLGSFQRAFISPEFLKKLIKSSEGHSAFLISKHVQVKGETKTREVYFPSGYYVMGNKS